MRKDMAKENAKSNLCHPFERNDIIVTEVDGVRPKCPGRKFRVQARNLSAHHLYVHAFPVI